MTQEIPSLSLWMDFPRRGAKEMRQNATAKKGKIGKKSGTPERKEKDHRNDKKREYKKGKNLQQFGKGPALSSASKTELAERGKEKPLRSGGLHNGPQNRPNQGKKTPIRERRLSRKLGNAPNRLNERIIFSGGESKNTLPDRTHRTPHTTHRLEIVLQIAKRRDERGKEEQKERGKEEETETRGLSEIRLKHSLLELERTNRQGRSSGSP